MSRRDAGPGAVPPLGKGLTLVLAVACGVSVANVYYAQPLLDRIGTDLAVGTGALGLVTTVTQAGYLLGLVLVVPLGDLVDRRRLIVAQSAMAALGLVAAAAAPGPAMFFVANAAVGFASVVVQVIVAYAAAHSDTRERGQVVGIVTSGVVVGILLARTVAGVVADLAGWRAIFLLAAALMLALAVLLARLLPPDPTRGAPVRYARLIGSGLTLAAREPVFRERSLIALFLFGSFGAAWGSMALPLSAAPWRLSAGQIGLFGLVGAAGALGAARAGRLADRGRGGWVTGVTLILLIASWAGIAATPYSLVALVIGVFVLDFAGQALHVVNQHLIVELDAQATSRLVGGYMVFYSIGTGAGAAAATGLYSVAGWTAVSILGAGLPAVALAVWGVPQLRGRRRGGTVTAAQPAVGCAPLADTST